MINKQLGTTIGVLTAAGSAADAQIVQITLNGNLINSGSGDALYADLTGDMVDDVTFNNIAGVTRAGGNHSYFADNYTIGIIRGNIGVVHTTYVTTRTAGPSIAQNDQGQHIYSPVDNIQLRMEGSASVPNRFHHLAGFDGIHANTEDYNIGNNGNFPDNPSIAVITPIVFKDTRINGGENTKGYLEMILYSSTTSSNPEVRDGTFKINRLIFDESNADRPSNVAVTDGAYTEWKAEAVPEPSSVALLALGAGGILLRRKREDAR